MAVQLQGIAGGLKDAKIRLADGTIIDCYAITEANGEAQQDEIEVKGDDQLLGTFISNKTEELSLTLNGLSFDMLQAITGNSASSSADGVEIALGTESEMNPPRVEFSTYSQAVDKDGLTCTLVKIWHKVDFKNVQASQAGEKEFSIECTAMAYMTDTDITGTNLSTKRICTLKLVAGQING